jgi:hypothetical protein
MARQRIDDALKHNPTPGPTFHAASGAGEIWGQQKAPRFDDRLISFIPAVQYPTWNRPLVPDQSRSGHSIPISGVTSYALSGEEKKARAAGCDDYVPKPFSPRQLLAKIHRYLQ